MCAHTCSWTHLSHPDWFYLGFDPMFGSRCWEYGKVLQEQRAEEPASLGGFRISHPRAVQGLESVPRTQGWAGDSTQSWAGCTHHPVEQKPLQPPDTEEEFGFCHI